MRAVAVVLLLCGITPAMAQKKIPEHKPTVQGTFFLPTALDNKMFTVLTSPLGEGELFVQIPLWKGFGIGLGAKVMGWDLKNNAFSQLDTHGDASRWTGALKVQYAHYTGPITFYEAAVRAGYSRWTWDCSTCESNTFQGGIHLAGTFGYYVHASKNLAFGIILGYESDAARFTPDLLCLNDFPGYEGMTGPYRFFTVGLGFSTRFEKDSEERW